MVKIRRKKIYPAFLFLFSIHRSVAGRYRPIKVADWPITARCRFIKNASWVLGTIWALSSNKQMFHFHLFDVLSYVQTLHFRTIFDKQVTVSILMLIIQGTCILNGKYINVLRFQEGRRTIEWLGASLNWYVNMTPLNSTYGDMHECEQWRNDNTCISSLPTLYDFQMSNYCYCWRMWRHCHFHQLF